MSPCPCSYVCYFQLFANEKRNLRMNIKAASLLPEIMLRIKPGFKSDEPSILLRKRVTFLQEDTESRFKRYPSAFEVPDIFPIRQRRFNEERVWEISGMGRRLEVDWLLAEESGNWLLYFERVYCIHKQDITGFRNLTKR